MFSAQCLTFLIFQWPEEVDYGVDLGEFHRDGLVRPLDKNEDDWDERQQ